MPASLTQFFIFVVLTASVFSCKEEEVTHPPVELLSTALSGVEGDTLFINLNNQDGLIIAYLDNHHLKRVGTHESGITVLVPYLEPGNYDLRITSRTGEPDGSEVILPDAFTYLPMEVIGYPEGLIPVLPRRWADSFWIQVRNIPLLDRELYHVSCDTATNALGSILPVEIRKDSIQLRFVPEFKPQLGAYQNATFYLGYRDQSVEIGNLKLTWHYRFADSSLVYIPGQWFVIYADPFIVSGRLGDVDMGEPSSRLGRPSYENGYEGFWYFKVPPLQPGTYTLKVFEYPWNWPLLPEGPTTIEVVDATFCPEVNSYQKTDSIRLNLSPDFRWIICFRECVAITLINELSGSRYICQMSFHTTYFMALPPADLPSGEYSVELRTDDNYYYKLTPECSNGVITIN